MNKRLSLSGVTLQDLQTEVDVLWNEAQTSEPFRQHLQDHGVDFRALPGLSGRDALQLSPTSYGFDGVSTEVLVAFAPLAAKILEDLWDVFFPILEQKLGKGSITEKRE